MFRPEDEALIEQIAAARGSNPCRIIDRTACSGGCIHQAEILHLEDGSSWFVKSSRSARSMLQFEASGLEALRSTEVIRVPCVLTLARAGQRDYLIMEAISQGRPGDHFYSQFGEKLALLHQRTQQERCGWSCDGFIGSTPQLGGWSENWVQFFREKRLLYQVRLAVRNRVATPELVERSDRLAARLDQLIGWPPEPACLLHGDLWSGNYLCDDQGEPVLIDPACYYGRREADLAMTLLFGGFPPEFLAAYRRTWPLEDGWQDRIEVYKLYHLLNHLNLFGASYLGGCLQVLRRFT